MKTILLIDDDENIRSTFGMALRHYDYRVIEASSGTEGLQLARKHLPDLVLSDISMPGMGGQEVLKSIRESPELNTTQVVLMTGQTHIVTPRKGMELGADDFLIKPISLQDLLQCVEARLKRAHVHWLVEDRIISKLRSTLHATMPHELFTPLAGIIGLVEILRANLSITSFDDISDLLKDIHSSALGLHRTLRNYLLVLELDAISDGKKSVEVLPAEKAEEAILSGVQAAVRRHGRENDIKVKMDPCDIIALAYDVNVMAEELVDNACKFSSKETPIEFSFIANGVMTVSDIGRGMTPEEVQQVGSFHQFDRKKFEQQGLGLGLSLTQKLTARCDATLLIKSEPTVGTVVKVAFKVPPPAK
jgi:two-component system, sensor histidine kinase and response regulator